MVCRWFVIVRGLRYERVFTNFCGGAVQTDSGPIETHRERLRAAACKPEVLLRRIDLGGAHGEDALILCAFVASMRPNTTRRQHESR